MVFMQKLGLWLKMRVVFGLSLAIALLLPANLYAKSSDVTLRSVYIYNFLKYSKWPIEVDVNEKKATICMIGDDNVLDALEAIREKKRLLGLVLKPKFKDSNFSDCHILYVSKNSAAEYAILADKINALPILTISTIDDFVNKGGIVEFVISDKQINMRCNYKTLKKSRILMDPELLKMMEVVHRYD